MRVDVVDVTMRTIGHHRNVGAGRHMIDSLAWCAALCDRYGSDVPAVPGSLHQRAHRPVRIAPLESEHRSNCFYILSHILPVATQIQ